MKLYVGNLPYEITEDELRQEFAKFGEVSSVSVPIDRYSGRGRGFAFVEMASKEAGEAAIAGLNGKTLKERTVVVNEARPRTEGPDRRRDFGDRGGGGRFGGGGRGGGGGRRGGRF